MMKSLSSHISKIPKYSKLNIECAAGQLSKSYETTKQYYRVFSKEKFVDDQILNFWFSVKIDQTQLFECWIFSAWHGTDDLLVESYRDEKLHRQAHNSPWRQSPSEHGNVMSGATSMHSFWRFSRECNTSFQVLAGDNRALALKNHVQARCKFSSRTPPSWAK